LQSGRSGRAPRIITATLERRQILSDASLRNCLPRDPALPALYDGAKILLIDEGSGRACGVFAGDPESLQAMREFGEVLGEVSRIARSEGC